MYGALSSRRPHLRKCLFIYYIMDLDLELFLSLSPPLFLFLVFPKVVIRLVFPKYKNKVVLKPAARNPNPKHVFNNSKYDVM